MSERKVRTRSPSDSDQITLGKPQTTAGGVAAVASSMKHSFGEAGVVRAATSLLKMNQTKGFDCPGCAWPEPQERSRFEFCENGAKAFAEEATTKRILPEFFRMYSVEELSLQNDQWLGKAGRLTRPMFLARDSKHYEPISWDSAFELIAKKLRSLDSPNRAVFYTSGRTSNEAAFVYQLMVRLYGTNNFPDCSNMCHESSGVGLYETIGSGKGTVTLEDFNDADLILVIGQNPGTNHPRMLSTLQRAARRGCTIVSINPLKEAGNTSFSHPQEFSGLIGRATALASLHVPVRINGDVALLKGIMKSVIERDLPMNRDFIEKHTQGFENFEADLRSADWQQIESCSGISREEIGKLAGIFAAAKNLIACWAMGLTQHQNAVANVQSVVNLLLMGGHFGRAGAGACPVRGHSNVQGDRTMGITERPRTLFLKNLATEFQFAPPRDHGLDTVGAIRAMHEGQAKVFFSMGGNFLSASPDTDYTARALQNCDLTVQVSTKLNRAHLVTGKEALILPCLGRTEADRQNAKPQFVTVENSMGVIHASQGHLEPASLELKSEVAIVAGLAEKLLPDRAVLFRELAGDYNKIRERIARVVPGFENMNDRLGLKRQFVLHHPVRDRLEFNTSSKKAHFTVHPVKPKDAPPGYFLMTTIRSHDQYNTTIYGRDDRYRGVYGGRFIVLMNSEDIEKQELVPGDRIDLVSLFQGKERKVDNFLVVAYEIPRGCVATYFPETNPLVALDDHAEKSGTPASKSVIVRVEKRK